MAGEQTEHAADRQIEQRRDCFEHGIRMPRVGRLRKIIGQVDQAILLQ